MGLFDLLWNLLTGQAAEQMATASDVRAIVENQVLLARSIMLLFYGLAAFALVKIIGDWIMWMDLARKLERIERAWIER